MPENEPSRLRIIAGLVADFAGAAFMIGVLPMLLGIAGAGAAEWLGRF